LKTREPQGSNPTYNVYRTLQKRLMRLGYSQTLTYGWSHRDLHGVNRY
jgi:hypothetical protein